MSALGLNSTCQADAETQEVTTDAAKREVLLSGAWPHTDTRDDAEDVAHDVFANCGARGKPVPTTVGELTTYARNAARDRRRRNKRHRHCTSLVEDSDDQISVRQLREMEIQAAREELALIWEAASDEERELLQLNLEGFTGSEIAAKLGVPPGTYYSRWLRLCARIRKEFADRLELDA